MPVGASVVGLSSVIGMTLQVSGLERLLSVSTPVRAGGTFLLVLLLGSLLRWRYELFVDEARSTSMSHPLAATGYGIVTHLVIAFAAVYLTVKFAQIQVAGQTFAIVGLVVGIGLVGVAGALGFTVVGEALVDLGGQPTQWAGRRLGDRRGRGAR